MASLTQSWTRSGAIVSVARRPGLDFTSEAWGQAGVARRSTPSAAAASRRHAVTGPQIARPAATSPAGSHQPYPSGATLIGKASTPGPRGPETETKPVRPGAPVRFQHGEVFHIACLARAAESTAIEQVDRAKVAHEDAAGLLDDSRRARAERRRLRSPTEACHSAALPTIVDWRPSVDWVVDEDRPCNGFFIRASLLNARLTTLPDEERQELARRVREFRAAGLEAWCTTSDGGRALRVSSVRPYLPT